QVWFQNRRARMKKRIPDDFSDDDDLPETQNRVNSSSNDDVPLSSESANPEAAAEMSDAFEDDLEIQVLSNSKAEASDEKGTDTTENGEPSTLSNLVVLPPTDGSPVD